MENKRWNKSGQATIFIIIAVLIVAFVAGYFALRGNFFTGRIPASLQTVENTFLTCLEDEVLAGIDVLESQGGYIELLEFEAGSDYMPFSSQLDFLGNPIPYWYYVSGNNFEREQIPTKQLMEQQLENFIEGEIAKCDFENSRNLGYEISKGNPNADVIIKEGEVNVDLKMDLSISLNEENAIIKSHKKTIKSNLGKLYDSALEVYDYQQKNLFLEKYALDSLRLYAPVDGVEISCNPLHWNADEVFENLSEAIEINTLALKNSGNADDYFLVDLPVSEEVNFVTFKNWPRTYEVLPSEENLLLASPVGNQPEFGILGFCYVPYHFVYDIKYPVLIQVSDGGETFQFPMAVIVQGNNPRNPLIGNSVSAESIELCKNKNTPVSVSVFDLNSNSVDAKIFYECFGERCEIGETSGGNLQDEFPQCVNGFVSAKASGFKDSKTLFSSSSGGSISIYLDKLYTLPVNLKLDGSSYSGEAVISFVSDDYSKTIIYPEQKTVELSEGLYDISVKIYRDSTLEFGDITREQCVDVPVGIFGFTRKKCFEIEIPSQLVSKALAGGGTKESFILDSELKQAKIIEVNAQSFPAPKTIEELQDNHALFENNQIEVMFR